MVKTAPVLYMSIQIVEYIQCSRCSYRLIGKIEKYLCFGNLGRASVFEVTMNWLCLNFCHIQSERIEIREIRENQLEIRP